ncbi:FMN-binding negative transcriptional regulator [Marinobacter daqiaonensis]|uniref:FMN-binding negative transcriptional regulator n=1 Tax=Marinobacter daqiaonensis TaxID=650891 RepID=UPI000B0F288C|nr:FMN-binding negative transcriptional regulator [Marinobacter daqiaonensis]
MEAPRVIEDAASLNQHVRNLTDQHESGMSDPWSVDDAPQDFIDRLVQAIVGIEISIETLTGKLKASQNQPERNRAGVRAGLDAGFRYQAHSPDSTGDPCTFLSG